MAVLWLEDTEAGGWKASPLRGRPVDLATSRTTAGEHAGVRLVRTAEPDDTWILMSEAASGVRVNGAPLSLGVRVLRHRDEIVLPGSAAEASRRWFYSGESVVEVVRLPYEETPTICPHCQGPIAAGTEAVRCPNPTCGAWYHQSGQSPCWAAKQYCDLCETPAVLAPGTRWSPEDL